MPRIHEELFLGFPIPEYNPERGGVRSPLEGYVIQEMPRHLQEAATEVYEGEYERSHESLAALQEEVLQQALPAIHQNTDPHQAKVTQMDLLFMLGGYLPYGSEAFSATPPSLLPLIDQQHDRFRDRILLPKRMDYETVIDLNTAEYREHGIIRVFTNGEYAPHERDFYIGHNMAEGFVKNAAYGLRRLATQPEGANVELTLETARDNLDVFRRHMGAYARLKEAFGRFRPYLSSYPDGSRNASGAFMPSVQLLETALHAPTEGYEAYMREAMDNFPTWSRPVIQEWYESSKQGQNIEAQIERGNLKLNVPEKELLLDIVKQFIGFRSAHYGITRRQIPEAFAPDAPVTIKDLAKITEEKPIKADSRAATGTGGFDVTNVLANAVHRLQAFERRLSGQN